VVSSRNLYRRESSLPPEIAENKELMQYAVRGSDAQWAKALEGKSVDDGPATIQLQSTREKRKLEEQDIEKEASQETKLKNMKGKKTKKKSKKSRR
jgi:hypothetical protein